MKKKLFIFTSFFLLLFLSGCALEKQEKKDEIVVGFSQLGNESAWRERNTQSITDAVASENYKLLFANGQQKQSKQIKDLRSFIASRVDIIVLSPIVETGWENVLSEAKEAGIPVLLNDREIHIDDPSLYQALIGTDAIEQGKKAAEFLKKKFQGKNEPINIVEVKGTKGASSAENRSIGFRQALEGDERFQIVHSENADYMLSKGKQVIEKMYREKQLDNVDVLFSHNDDMTIGIVEFLRTTPIRPGKDLVIVSVDAQQEAIDLLKAGEINCTVECNPDSGPKLVKVIDRLLNNGPLEKEYYLDEKVFSEFTDLSTIKDRGY